MCQFVEDRFFFINFCQCQPSKIMEECVSTLKSRDVAIFHSVVTFWISS